MFLSRNYVKKLNIISGLQDTKEIVEHLLQVSKNYCNLRNSENKTALDLAILNNAGSSTIDMIEARMVKGKINEATQPRGKEYFFVALNRGVARPEGGGALEPLALLPSNITLCAPISYFLQIFSRASSS